MTRGRKVLIGAGLAAVIACIVVWTIRSQLRRSQVAPWVMQQPVEKIDIKTLQLMTRPMGKWISLGHQVNRYKNPETGEYTMVSPMICGACGEMVPEPAYPKELRGIRPDELSQMQAEYICPKCGRHPFTHGRGGAKQ